MISSENVLSRQLKPLCSRDNQAMKYESGGSRANTGHEASYHCGSVGCSVRYNSTDGYYMLIGMPGHAYAVDEPGVNTVKCPIHGRWLYRQKILTRNRVFGGFVASKVATMVTPSTQRAIGSELSEDPRPHDAGP
jgi:hypothetical protein